MGRFYLLAVITALIIPVLLPDTQHAATTQRHMAKAQDVRLDKRSIAPVANKAQKDATPASLQEALLQVVQNLPDSFEGDARCLAQAVYFEARSEPLEGQLAVAQVVLNRVESAFWPNSVCDVVFQNEHWRHRCQFSFACDGLSDTPKNPTAWRRAKLVAGVALNGLWQDLSLAATHYHADYVAPSWREGMHHTTRFGRHLFYRDQRHAAISSEDAMETADEQT